MHILWINHDAGLTGGCERYIADTAAMLRESGISSSLLYSVEGPTEPRFTRLFDRGAFPLVDLAMQLRETTPDLIYVHRWEGTDFLAELRRCEIPKVRFFHDHRLFCPREHKYTVLGKQTCTRTVGWNCYTCLGVVNRVPASDGLIRLRLPGTLRREQEENIQTFQGFVTGSGYMAGHLIAHGFPVDRVHAIPLFTSPTEDSPTATLPARDPETLLFVGQLVTGKGVDTLLEALALTERHCRLRILGTGKFESAYRAQAARLGIEDRVTFVGKVVGPALAREYQRATALVFPSRSPETFGLVGPEAMRYGTPVIATNIGGMTEWLRDSVNGLAVPPNAPLALSRAIDRLLHNDGLREKLGAAAERLCRSHFTPEQHGRALTALLERLVIRQEYVPSSFAQEALV